MLEVLSAYLFNLYYMKGKEITISDFLSRIKVENSNLQEIILISFDLQEVLQEKYYICTRSRAQKIGIAIGKAHSHNKPYFLI